MRTERATVGDTDRADALKPEIRIVEGLNDDPFMPCERCASTGTHLVRTGGHARLLCKTCAAAHHLDHQIARQRQQFEAMRGR